jgi:hypothetical protein
MTQAFEAKPEIDIWLFKTIGRSTLDGNWAVSGRYEGRDEYIDLTPFLNVGSAVRTSKSVREPAGGFNISFADKPQESFGYGELESVYGLIEPMDVIEIRMWHGFGPRPLLLPIVMRGVVSSVSRQRAMGEDGRPQRMVSVSGHDYGKFWQTYQVLYMPAYASGKPLLTNFNLWELLGISATNTMSAAEFVKKMTKEIINKYIDELFPANFPTARQITIGDGVSVSHGVVNNNYQNAQGSVYEIMRTYGDVGIWNELYVEDREDGVHLVYRPIPAFLLSTPENRASAKIQDDAPVPGVSLIKDQMIKSINATRSDSNVANFFWVNNSKFDLIDDIVRKQFGLAEGNGSVNLGEYANSAVKYYGVRPMYGETQQGEDAITNMASNLSKELHEARSVLQMSWIDDRRRIMAEMNKDNVVYERGSAVVKGGPIRVDAFQGADDLLKAGDYVVFIEGTMKYMAYAYQVEHEYLPFQSYTTSIQFDRGEGFATRASLEGSPWLAEQSRRADDNLGLI